MHKIASRQSFLARMTPVVSRGTGHELTVPAILWCFASPAFLPPLGAGLLRGRNLFSRQSDSVQFIVEARQNCNSSGSAFSALAFDIVPWREKDSPRCCETWKRGKKCRAPCGGSWLPDFARWVFATIRPGISDPRYAPTSFIHAAIRDFTERNYMQHYTRWRSKCASPFIEEKSSVKSATVFDKKTNPGRSVFPPSDGCFCPRKRPIQKSNGTRPNESWESFLLLFRTMLRKDSFCHGNS